MSSDNQTELKDESIDDVAHVNASFTDRDDGRIVAASEFDVVQANATILLHEATQEEDDDHTPTGDEEEETNTFTHPGHQSTNNKQWITSMANVEKREKAHEWVGSKAVLDHQHTPQTLKTKRQQAFKTRIVNTIPRCIFPAAYLDSRSPTPSNQILLTEHVLAQIHWHTGFSRHAIDWLVELQDRLAWHVLHQTILTTPDLAKECVKQRAQPEYHRIKVRPIFPDRVHEEMVDVVAYAVADQDKALDARRNGDEDGGIVFTFEMADRWMAEFERTAPEGWKLAPEIHTPQEKLALCMLVENFIAEFVEVGGRLAMDELKTSLITVNSFQYIKDPELAVVVTFLNMDDPACTVAGNDAPWPFPTPEQTVAFPDQADAVRPLQYQPNKPLEPELEKMFANHLTQWRKKDREESWYHQPELVRKYADQYAKLQLPPGDATLWRQYHIHPVQYYGREVCLFEFAELYAPVEEDKNAPSVTFDLIDAGGVTWPFFVQLERTKGNMVGVIRLRGPCEGAGAGADTGSTDSRWKGWTEEIVGHIDSCRVEKKKKPTRRHHPTYICITEREKLCQAYEPWGLWTTEDPIPRPPLPDFLSASLPTAAYELASMRAAELRISELSQEDQTAASIEPWDNLRRLRESRLYRAEHAIKRATSKETAARLELEQLIGVVCETLLHEGTPSFGPTLFTQNHPMEVRVAFTEALLHRIFNPPASDDDSTATSPSSDNMDRITWLPNVLLHLIAEYDPAHLPYSSALSPPAAAVVANLAPSAGAMRSKKRAKAPGEQKEQ